MKISSSQCTFVAWVRIYKLSTRGELRHGDSPQLIYGRLSESTDRRGNRKENHYRTGLSHYSGATR